MVNLIPNYNKVYHWLQLLIIIKSAAQSFDWALDKDR
jgi:hypothetical protein